MELALRGWFVHPLAPRDKKPLTSNGFKDASNNPGQVVLWWGEWPDANIGVAVETSGLLVVDFDPRNDEGEAAFAELMADCEETGTLSSSTGGGGRHFFFKRPEGDRTFRSTLGPGIDLKAKGYIVAPPSVHPSGVLYEWDMGSLWDPSEHATKEATAFRNGMEVLPAPDWLLELATREARVIEEKKEVDPNDVRPGTLFNAQATWAEILEPHGWTFVKAEDDVEYWCRPGKKGSISATTNYEDSGLFYVFTSSTEFEQNRGYDKLGAYALLNHAGDIEAAAKEIRELWLPQRRLEIDLSDLFDAPATAPPPKEWEPAFPEDHFVGAYLRHAMRQTDAAPEYHEAAALTLLAVATPNFRANLAPYPNGLQTNLYLTMVGESSTSRKSTCQDIMTAVLSRYYASGVLPSKQTTESLVEMLSAANGNPRIWLPDEFGMVIAEIGRRDFLRGIEDLLLELYGGKPYAYATKSGGVTEVRHSHLSVFGASTPEALALAGPTAMLGGLLPRFGIVFPRGRPAHRSMESVADLDKERLSLVRRLQVVTEVTQEAGMAKFTPAAMSLLNAAESTLTGEGLHAARLPIMLYKVATLSAAGRNATTVSEEDANAAVKVINRWLDGARHLQPYLRRKAGDIEFARMQDTVLDVLDELGGEAPRWKIARQLRMPKARLDQLEAALVDQAFITVDLQTKKWKRRTA
jgi:hypothetical protein